MLVPQQFPAQEVNALVTSKRYVKCHRWCNFTVNSFYQLCNVNVSPSAWMRSQTSCFAWLL